MSYKCPNGYEINIECMFENYSKFADWNYNPICKNFCPPGWLYIKEDGFCYSLPFTSKTTFHGAKYDCENFHYRTASLLAAETEEQLFFITNLSYSNGLKFPQILWIDFQTLSEDSTLYTQLLNLSQEFQTSGGFETLCATLKIFNSSWKLGIEACSNSNAYSCRIRAPRCPEANTTFLNLLKFWPFDYEDEKLTGVTIGKYMLWCDWEHRIPMAALLTKGSQSDLDLLLSGDWSYATYEFWGSELFSCVADSETGVPEWIYSDLIECEFRSCPVTEEMMLSPYLQLVDRLGVIKWNGSFNESYTPKSHHEYGRAIYYCPNGYLLDSECGDTYIYDAEWDQTCDFGTLCPTLWAQKYTTNGKCFYSWNDGLNWENTSLDCARYGYTHVKPDTDEFLSELVNFIPTRVEKGIWIGFSTIQPDSIEYLATLTNMHRYIRNDSFMEFIELQTKIKNGKITSRRCFVMKTMSNATILFLDDCTKVYFPACNSNGGSCPEIRLNNSIRSTEVSFNGTELEFKCKRGYTRLEENKDKVICHVEKGFMKWKGDLNDCELNYCPDFNVSLINSELLRITFGFSPENEPQQSGVYYENATIVQKCNHGYLYRGMPIAVQSCTFNSSGMGRGKWEPEIAQCIPVECANPDTIDFITNAIWNKTKAIIIQNGTFKYLYGDEVTFTCKDTYIFTNQKIDRTFVCEHVNDGGKWVPINNETVIGCIAMSPQREVYFYLVNKLNASKYLHQFRPRKNYLSPVIVKISFVLTGLRSLDQSGTMETSANLNLIWEDEYVAWQDIDHIEFYKDFPVQVPKSQIWVPGIGVSNSPGGIQYIEMRNETLLNVYYLGNVSVSFSKIFSTECELDLIRFPFDEQECSIEIIFPGYAQKEVQWLFEEEDDGEERTVAEFDHYFAWEVKDKSCEPKVSSFKVSGSAHFGNTSQLEYSVFSCRLKLKRNPSTALFFVVVPTVAITVFNMISFLLPSGEDGKVGMNMDTFLSFMMLQGIINTIVPTDTAQIPALATYVLLCLILSSLNVCISCFLCWLSHGSYKMSNWMKNSFLKWGNKFRIPDKTSNEADKLEETRDNLTKYIMKNVGEEDELNRNPLLKEDQLEIPVLKSKNKVGPASTPSHNNENIDLQSLSGQIDFKIPTVGKEQEIIQTNTNIQETEVGTKQPDTFEELLKSNIESQKYLHFLAVNKITRLKDPTVEANEDLVILAKIINRMSGIILTLINIGLLIWTIVTLLI